MDLAKTYSPTTVEAKWYERWEKSGAFQPKVEITQRPSYVIVIPPPNVTGMLHMGHALNNTVQDILVRLYRMRNFSTLWLPGTDHAGIATQNVVERKLEKEGKDREALGREKFIQEVWKWKEDHGSAIIRQLKRLGCSSDWTRERFTMDEGLSRAVREAFVRLYRQDLIYRGNRIINWCPRCHTALSDEEAPHKEVQGHLYYIQYPVLGKKNEHITVATTRPETLLGDTAVAVHPGDDRYEHLHGKRVLLPLVNRELPVICDEAVDPDFGSGIVKVTPAHDPNDYEMGLRHGLEIVNVLHPDGRINDAGGFYSGLDRFEARRRILSDLEEKGLLVKTVSHLHAVGHCYRCHSAIEPYLSEQWFVRMKPLAEKALRQKGVAFHPARWEKVYLAWMGSIRDWCISRQIWWGHRIPVWHCADCGKFTVETEEPRCCSHCSSLKIAQDPDVLDTWFSSWLWPFSTLGWPEATEDLKRFYPTSDLVTAPDIIFFWVARMIMAGCWFLDRPPFANVYIHGTVRTDTGQKMSKSLGNAIDPIHIIEEIGADALRFSIVMLTASGQDAYLSREKFELGRNFTNKIWNAARFALIHLEGFREGELRFTLPVETLGDLHGWILSRLAETHEQVTSALGAYRFNEAATLLYHFVWNDFCDWYLELVKPLLKQDDRTAQKVLFHVLYQIVKLLHPFMPYVTEEIWERLALHGREPYELLIRSNWDTCLAYQSPETREIFEALQEAVVRIRDFRSLLGLDPKAALKAHLELEDPRRAERFGQFLDQVRILARLTEFSAGGKCPAAKGERWIGRPIRTGRLKAQVWIALEKDLDLGSVTNRLEKLRAQKRKFIASLTGKLDEKDFIGRAPEEVIVRERQKLADAGWELERLEELLEKIKEQ